MRTLAILAVVAACLTASGYGRLSAEASLFISGTIWDDYDADGVRQADERPFSRLKVTLLREGDREVLHSVTPDEDGAYSFAGLEAGAYRVQLQEVYHRALTFPKNANLPPFEIALDLDSSVETVDFGLHNLINYPSFAGLAWVNAEPANYADVRAIIDGVDCTGLSGPRVSGLNPAWYQITVVPSTIKTGCGSYGKTIQFTINGFLANETREWEQAYQGPDANVVVLHEMPDLIAGPPMAYYTMAVFNEREEQTQAPGNVLIAYIDRKVCGIAQDAGAFGVLLSVPSERTVGGCGYEGAEITFTFNGAPIPQRGIWREGRAGMLFIPYRPGTRPRASQSELPGQIAPPSVGDGGLR